MQLIQSKLKTFFIYSVLVLFFMSFFSTGVLAATSSTPINLPAMNKSININLTTQSYTDNTNTLFKKQYITLQKSGWMWASVKISVIDNSTKKAVYNTNFTNGFKTKIILEPGKTYTIKVTRTSSSVRQIAIIDSYGLK